ncbi:alpha/beta hydrolase [Lysobacter sp. CW239]|jgi:alpha-beta hydrolase superfamily lysophospholipase|uniref:alpha/beta hydrolase n=1 Tax=Lysobacteraceae TaxID=32033 RepID=UPI0012EBF20D|nr:MULTISPECIES: alpha/beta hydrolase [Lysobacter]QOD92024.1 alpha/beta hydrolase [Lysobacter sp. CW239]
MTTVNPIPPPASWLGQASNRMGESVHCFGPGLVGVLHHPRAAVAQRTAVILMNAGLVHRIGPFRSYVLLARVLAAAGFPVLRFDQGGLGDSAASKLGSVERRQGEITAAMSLLVATGEADRFVLGGICSGADDAFLLAGLETRVVGLILLDGLAYRTLGFWWRHLLAKLRMRDRWKRLLRLRWRLAMDEYREHPSRAEAAKQLARLVARDVRLLLLYTGGSERYFNYRGQLSACLGRAACARQVTLELWKDCDHTFYLQRDRQRLQQTLVSWMQREFGSDDESSPPRREG